MNDIRAKIIEHINQKLFQEVTGRNIDRLIWQDRFDEKFFIGLLSAGSTEHEEFQTRARTKQIGIDILLKKEEVEKIKLTYSVSGSFFYRVFPSLTEQREFYVKKFNENFSQQIDSWNDLTYFLQNNPSFKPIKCDVAPVFCKIKLVDEPIEYRLAGKELDSHLNVKSDAHREFVLNMANSSTDYYYIIREEVELKDLNSKDKWQEFIRNNKSDRMPLQWDFDYNIKEIDYDKDRMRISFTWSNMAQVETRNGKLVYDGIRVNEIFDCKIKLKVDGGEPCRFTMKGFAEDYKYDRTIKAIGKNCFIEENNVNGNILETNPCPVYEQYRLKVRRFGLIPTFEGFSKEPLPILDSIASEMDKYIENFDIEVKEFFAHKGLDMQEKKTQLDYEKADFSRERERFKKGISILKNCPDVLQAFRLMNKSFLNSSINFNSWHLFQIVFIVSLLPDFAKNKYSEIEGDSLDKVDLLYFPTGGGKTEAFLGLIIFNLFFDRLRGKKLGVTALVKYPLRLLSIQQMQRIADIVASAEKIRREEENLKDSEGFAVGYFVGESNTPNKIDKKESQNLVKMSQDNLTKQYLILDKCPFCQKKGMIIKYLEQNNRLAHFCPNCDEGLLPIYIVDREIYRYLPSVVVSTIDKYAGVGNQRNFRNILGCVSARCSLHGFTSQLECTEKGFAGVCTLSKDKLEKVNYQNLSPTLLVQDELHLLSESLGIFDSHYETFIKYFIEHLMSSTSKLKIIAATATISHYKNQIKHLYMQDAIRFPTPSPNPNKSFYYMVDYNELNRVFIGIAPVGITPKTAVYKIVELLRNYIFEYYDSPVKLNNELKLKLSDSEIKEILRDYWTILEYNQKKSDTLNICDTLGKTVNPKLKEQARFNIENLTGDKKLEEVRQIISDIENPNNPLPSPDFLAATSMISHGVDIDIFNIMVLYGVPQTIGEYIQATSRVGRQHPAFVFCIFIVNREKDRSYYKYFKQFNECKDILIEPVPINRWVNNAVDRTLPGIFFALMLLYYDFKIQNEHGSNIYLTGGFRDAVKNGWLASSDNIADMVIQSYLAYGPSGELFREKIKVKVKDIYDKLSNWSLSKRDFIATALDGYHPMRSLRDTDIQIEIEHPQLNKTMSRGVMQLLYRHFPCTWLYFDKGRLEQEVSFIDFWDSREIPVANLNKKRLLKRVEKYISGFGNRKNINIPLNENEYLVLQPIRAHAVTKAETYFCTNNKCNKVFKKHALINGNCPDCHRRASQMPLVYACDCGWTGPVEVMGCRQHGLQDMRFRDGRYDTRSWICKIDNQAVNVRTRCPECQKVPLYPKNIGDASISIPRTVTMIDLVESDKEKSLEHPNGVPLIYATWLGKVSISEAADLFRSILNPLPEQEDLAKKMEEEVKQNMENLGVDENLARRIAEKYLKGSRDITGRLNEINNWISDKIVNLSEDAKRINATSILEFETINSLKEARDLSTISEFNKQLLSQENLQDYKSIANKYGFISVKACSNVPMVYCNYGYSRNEFEMGGSTTLLGFPPDREVKARFPGKKNIYAQKYNTEGIVFELDRARILFWLLKNKIVDRVTNNLPGNLNNEEEAKLWFINNLRQDLLSPFKPIKVIDHKITYYVHTLTHTLSHMLIKNAEALLGLDKNSLGEYSFLTVPSFLIYSHDMHDFPLGAFFNLFANSFQAWLENSFEASSSCINDPICIEHLTKEPGDETASCFDCLHLNEISCQYMNYNLDRKLLTGKVKEDKHIFFGYWENLE
ncbi:MAG: DEAD/DEAH box helicase [Candidatus Omnitrophota bacterium]